MGLVEKSATKCHGGLQKVYSHESRSLGCNMTFGAYLPEKAVKGEKCPVLYWLSGLTCTEANFIQKAGFQQYAAKHGIIVVNPDTSPRGCNIEGEDDSWDFGSGAGFYLDATEPKWKANYNMYSYVTGELTELVNRSFQVLPDKQGIFGHSMGGHGAITIALKNPGKYLSVSAFSPISNPMNCPWGEKAFANYLGADRDTWKAYDSSELIASYSGPKISILASQGTSDGFLVNPNQLLPNSLVVAASANELVDVDLRMDEGYDHSFFYISSFIQDHMEHHAKALCQ